jgi:hypothetical protein
MGVTGAWTRCWKRRATECGDWVDDPDAYLVERLAWLLNDQS